MNCNYVIGSDKKTRDIALKINALINSAQERGDFDEATRLANSALSTPNIPLRMEILHIVETQEHKAP